MAQAGFKALAVIGLLLGIGSIGWLAYDQFIIGDASPTLSSRQYYDYYGSIIFTSSDGTYANNYLSIDFTVNSGENVYFSYVSTAIIDDSSRPYTEIYFYFEVDGIRWSTPYQLIKRWNENDPDGADIRYQSVALQHYNTTMTQGNHTCSVAIFFYDSGDSVWQQSLFIEVYP
jgi:hypothetical protein